MFLVKNFQKFSSRHLFGALFIMIVNISAKFCMEIYEKANLRNQAKDMYLFAYDSYMKHAFPADEILPISCRGRYRQIGYGRGDIDDALGNFSLTLIDGMDTLVIMQEYEKFEDSIKKVIENVSFDSDIAVSVFETNIRILGGLLSSHILVLALRNYLANAPPQNNETTQNASPPFNWYNDELLHMASDIGYRLLPAFNSPTGIPYSKVNLRYGLNGKNNWNKVETCTACAGTLILEFAALSRLTGNPIFERKAKKALDVLWQSRDKDTNLVGSTINVETGEWTQKESGVGAGSDSYYEYLLKSYVLLGDETHYERFIKHYTAIRMYMSEDPFLFNVYMQRPEIIVNDYMDALSAFWPGLQVLYGDVSPAIQTHAMLNKLSEKYGFLPESFNTNFQIRWNQHFLRPELIESTYILYQVTRDDFYLEVGKQILNNIRNVSKSPCGFASLSNVRTRELEDRMDSFVLSELFKYLYLLFSEDSREKHVGPPGFDLNDYVLTTEAHLLPLSLYNLGPKAAKRKGRSTFKPNIINDGMCFAGLSNPLGNVYQNTTKQCDFERVNQLLQCPKFYTPFHTPDEYARDIRARAEAKLEARFNKEDNDSSKSSERSTAQDIFSKLGFLNEIDLGKQKLKLFFKASSTGGPVSLSLVLKEIGESLSSTNSLLVDLQADIKLIRQSRISLTDTNVIFAKQSCNLALFDQTSLKGQPEIYQHIPPLLNYEWPVLAMPSQLLPGTCANFGFNLTSHNFGFPLPILRLSHHSAACEPFPPESGDLNGRVVIVRRGGCNFVEKVKHVQDAGASGVVIVDNMAASDYHSTTSFLMSGHNNDSDLEIKIPSMLIYSQQFEDLEKRLNESVDPTPLAYLYSTPYWDNTFNQSFVRCWLPHVQMFAPTQEPPFKLNHLYIYSDQELRKFQSTFSKLLPIRNDLNPNNMRVFYDIKLEDDLSELYDIQIILNTKAFDLYKNSPSLSKDLLNSKGTESSSETGDLETLPLPILAYLCHTESSLSEPILIPNLDENQREFDLTIRLSVIFELDLQFAQITVKFSRIRASPYICSETLLQELVDRIWDNRHLPSDIVALEEDLVWLESERENIKSDLRSIIKIGLGEKLPLKMSTLHNVAKLLDFKNPIAPSSPETPGSERHFVNTFEGDINLIEVKSIINHLVTLYETSDLGLNIGDPDSLKIVRNKMDNV